MTMMANTKIKRIRRFAEGTGLVLVLALTLVGCKGAEDEPAARNGRPEGRRHSGCSTIAAMTVAEEGSISMRKWRQTNAIASVIPVSLTVSTLFTWP